MNKMKAFQQSKKLNQTTTSIPTASGAKNLPAEPPSASQKSKVVSKMQQYPLKQMMNASSDNLLMGANRLRQRTEQELGQFQTDVAHAAA